MSVTEIRNIRVRLEVVLGSAEHTVEEVAAIGEGTIVELDTLAGEPVELRAGGTAIARGEVVVIDENFGIRVTKVLDDDSGEQHDE
jgi:flagellar motor switch protein FliN